MSEAQLTPPPETGPRPPSRPRPTLLSSWRGIWLLTWKTQLTWRRLPLGWLRVLALPILVYLTIPGPASGPRHLTALGNAAAQVGEFSRRLGQGDSSPPPLTSTQQAELTRIFQEEFSRAESEPPGAQAAGNQARRQREQIAACYGRIEQRARSLLDSAQFSRFQTFKKRLTQQAQGRVPAETWNRNEAYYHWLIDFYFFVILPLQCVRACGSVIRDDLQADTLGYLATRPLSRARLLLLKFAAHMSLVQASLLLETLLLFGVGMLREIPALGSLIPLLLAVQIPAVLAWSALGVFLGQITGRYMALAMVYGLVVELGIGRIPTNINTLSLMRHLKSLLSHHAPLQQVYDWSTSNAALSLGALLIGAAIFLAAAASLYTFREYHATSEMHK